MHGHRINEIYKLAGKEDKLLEIETEIGKIILDIKNHNKLIKNI